ncbi:MAG: methyltransferase domain-containing protein [Eubacteriales bacterium]
MKKFTELEEHYNKFSEEKRLTRRHGQVEYITTMKYIHKYLDMIKRDDKASIKVLDIGAGTGRYSIELDKEGYDVTAVELVKYNIGVMKAKGGNVKIMQGNALNLKKLEDECYDITLLFGPMYHLFSEEDKIKALSEAKRVTKKDGVIMVAYLMNEYGILIHGFRDGYIKGSIATGKVTKEFSINNNEEDLYDYVQIKDIDNINHQVGLSRVQMIASTGQANYMRQVLNAMDEETFQLFIDYHLQTCEREDLIGASSHVVDILK